MFSYEFSLSVVIYTITSYAANSTPNNTFLIFIRVGMCAVSLRFHKRRSATWLALYSSCSQASQAMRRVIAFYESPRFGVHAALAGTVKPGYNEVYKNSHFFVTFRFSLHAGLELKLAGVTQKRSQYCHGA